MRHEDIIGQDVDWTTILLFAVLVLLGLANIYAAGYNDEINKSLFYLTGTLTNTQRQIIFIAASCVLIIGIMVVDFRFFEAVSFFIYGVVLFTLLLVPVIGKEVGGNKNWIGIGTFGIQPSEFAKFATALAVSKIIGSVNFRIDNFRNQLSLFALMSVPIALILLQKDFGTAMVFTVFILVFFREGLSPKLIIIGLSAAFLFIITLIIPFQTLLLSISIIALVLIGWLLYKKRFKISLLVGIIVLAVTGFIASVDYSFSHFLKPHHQNRIKALINPDADPKGYGWNVTQSKIAIGSGGLTGKGFLKGTQTKFDFVPEQDTDFIFCTIGEEHGWMGSVLVIALFVIFLLRLIYIAERQKQRFARVFGYSVVCILFFHFAVNIGMTIGLFPVIGIPLPFFSYGGSSLMSFTILLFIFLKLDAHRGQVLQRI